jgi:hypothetical protein
MKLTTEQIAIIDETLVLNGLIYDDIKLEVTDHIASEIEAKMGESNISFDDALYQVLLNWKEQMKPSSSFWLGGDKVAPKIVIDKLILNTKRPILKGILLILILAVLLMIFERSFNDEIVFENTRIVFRFIFMIELCLLLCCKYLIWKSRYVTVFGFIYKKLNFWGLCVLFLFGIGLMPLIPTIVDFKINSSLNFLPIAYIIWPIYYLQLAYKHFQFERKFKLL